MTTFDFAEDWASILEEEALAEEREDGAEDGDATGSGNHDPRALQDAHVAETVANRALAGRYCWARGLDWMHYSRGRWTETSEARVSERVRRDLIDQHAREGRDGAEADRLKALSALLSAPRIRAIVSLTKGILEADAADFDQRPDLLNVGNGVVDLTTGELLPHDPALLMTKKSPVDYNSTATSADWAAALLALPAPVAEWMQVRVGQAATGHPTPDDIMPTLQGGGSNGKTTVMSTITKALGSHAVTVPERVLLANPSDHPTELMTLRGARFALIEETPEARHLSVKRLKDTVGTPTMTARYIGRNNVTWEATHSLFLTTNYVPRVDETDHGTWRRLALVRFPFTYATPGETVAGAGARPGVTGLRERLREGRRGQHEAVLVWIVEGARRWYAHDRVMPPAPATVKADTAAWRAEADLICGYISDRLVFDRQFHIMTAEAYADFCAWLVSRGHRTWADQTFTSRFAGHEMVEAAGVEKKRTRATASLSRLGAGWKAPPNQYTAWHGVRFRTEADDDLPADGKQTLPDLPKQAAVQGVQGLSAVPHEDTNIEKTKQPLHSLHTAAETGDPLGLARFPGRCQTCGFHVETQGHAPNCSQRVAP